MPKRTLPATLLSVLALLSVVNLASADIPSSGLGYHYCTSPQSETVYGLGMLEISEKHAALARRIHGVYRQQAQASLPQGHQIVDVHVSGSGIECINGVYEVTLTWYYCVRIMPFPLPQPDPIPNP